MKCQNNQWTPLQGWSQKLDDQFEFTPDIILVFYSPLISISAPLSELKERFPQANTIAISTGGEVFEKEVNEGSLSAAFIKLEQTTYKIIEFDINSIEDSKSVGQKMGKELTQQPQLSGVLLFSDGLHTNGTSMLVGLSDHVDKGIKITGGLAGDGDKFESTLIGHNKEPKTNKAIAIGFYGEKFVMGHGSAGGWDNFGPRREVTKSKGNVLFELDNQPALDLYKKYLSQEQINQLPLSGLLFPLSINPPDQVDHDIVRTIVGVDEEQRSLIFAGDIPEGYTARLMMGSFDRLIDGAAEAAKMAFGSTNEIKGDQLNIMISCIGRRLLLGQQTEDEIDAVHEHVSENTKSLGFYSYGEISPHPKTKVPGLHNQTMTISLLGEKG